MTNPSSRYCRAPKGGGGRTRPLLLKLVTSMGTQPQPAKAQTATEQPSFRCVHCSSPCSSLCERPPAPPSLLYSPRRPVITYATIENTALLLCSNCGHDLDVYQTHSYPLILLDLLLLKARVYRHLLFNRGAGNAEERAAERRKSAWRVGGVVIGLDACESRRALGRTRS